MKRDSKGNKLTPQQRLAVQINEVIKATDVDVFAAVGALTMVGTVLTAQVYDLRMRPAEDDDEDCEPPAEATVSPDEPVDMGVGEAVEQPAIRPIPLDERLPKPKDCLEAKHNDGIMHYCWLGYTTEVNGEEFLSWDWKCTSIANEFWWQGWTYWLPASTRYLPARVEG